MKGSSQSARVEAQVMAAACFTARSRLGATLGGPAHGVCALVTRGGVRLRKGPFEIQAPASSFLFLQPEDTATLVEAAAGSKLWELDFRIPRAIWKELPRLAEPAKTPRVWRAADRDVRRFHLAFLNIDRERLGQWPHSIEVQEAWLHWVLVCFERSLRRTRVQKALSRERPGNGHGAESEAHSWDTSNSPTPTILPDSDGLTG